MSISHEYEYEKAADLKAVLRLLSRPVAGGAVALAGGTDLIAWLRDDQVAPGLLVDIKGIAELRGIRHQAGTLWIGAGTTFSELIDSKLVARHAPVLLEAAGMVASVGVRNRASIGGNLCSAVPCADSAPPLMVYGATLHIQTPRGRKNVPITKWFLGPRQTVLSDGSLLTGISLKTGKHAGAFVKLKRYRGEDLAQASVAVRVDPAGNWQVSYGSVAPTPIRGPKVERLLKGNRSPDEALLKKAAAIAEAEVAPITDIRSSEVYRRLMVGVMLVRGIRQAVQRARGGGAPYGINVLEEDTP